MQLIRCRWFALALCGLLGAHAHAQNQNEPRQAQTRQLLDWLGFTQLLEQSPLALEASIEAEAGFRNATAAQQAAWRRELQPRLRPQQLQQDLLNYVLERYRPENFQHVEALLQGALAKRVRYFDLAMTQPGAPRTLVALRASEQGEPAPVRRALLQEIDAAASTSQMVAVLHTGVTERVRRTAGAAPSDEAALLAEVAERQRFLAPLTTDYALYAYRFLRDDELVAYRDLLRDPELQWLLDVSRQGLAAVLRGDLRPPDSPR